MAGRGPAPKGTRARDRDTPDFRELTDSGEMHGAPLPAGVLPDGEEWHPQTLRLWDSLRRSPLLAEEPELGWMFLMDTMLMHTVMWQKGRWEYASEIRLRLAKYGATPEDRMRLKIKVQMPTGQATASAQQAATDGTVTSIRNRRSRLSS